MRVPDTGTVDLEDRLVAVGVDGVLQLLCEQVEGLVPTDLVPLPGAALGAVAPLQRSLDAVGVVDALAHVAAAHAGPDLTIEQTVVTGVVG